MLFKLYYLNFYAKLKLHKKGGNNMQEYNRLNRIREALQLRGMKQVELCEKSGVKKSALNSWIAQRWQPKADALNAMSRVLNVSEMWLAGYDVPMERPLAQIKNDELAQLINEIRSNDDLRDLCISICSLNDDQRITIKSMVNELSKLNSLH
jgi:transcriptional regulator with XRE-family HTH domain